MCANMSLSLTERPIPANLDIPHFVAHCQGHFPADHVIIMLGTVMNTALRLDFCGFILCNSPNLKKMVDTYCPWRGWLYAHVASPTAAVSKNLNFF